MLIPSSPHDAGPTQRFRERSVRAGRHFEKLAPHVAHRQLFRREASLIAKEVKSTPLEARHHFIVGVAKERSVFLFDAKLPPCCVNDEIAESQCVVSASSDRGLDRKDRWITDKQHELLTLRRDSSAARG